MMKGPISQDNVIDPENHADKSKPHAEGASYEK